MIGGTPEGTMYEPNAVSIVSLGSPAVDHIAYGFSMKWTDNSCAQEACCSPEERS